MVLVRPMNGKSWPDLPKTDTVQSLENVQKQSIQKRSHLGTVNHNQYSRSEIQSFLCTKGDLISESCFFFGSNLQKKVPNHSVVE